MPDRVVVVGGGGFGREVILYAEDCLAAGTLAPVAGYIDDMVEALPGYDVERIGTIQDYSPRPGDLFIVAVGEPAKKRKLVEMLQGKGGKFATLLHPSTMISRTATIEEGVIMTPHAMALPDAKLERFVTLNNFSGIGHDSVAGEFSTLSALVDVTGNCRLGKDVMIGSGARLLPKVTIGDGAVVGAGAVVVRSVKPGMTVYAAPARILSMKAKAGPGDA